MTVSLHATDPDGDGVSLSSPDAPAFATLTDLGGGAGSLRAEPGDGDAGGYTVTIDASDGQSTSSSTFQPHRQRRACRRG